MTKKYFIISAAVLVVIIVVFESQKAPIVSESVTQTMSLETQTNSEGPVEITVVPKNLSDKELLFKITLNTHSEELLADLTKNAVLVDNKGNEYSPIDWQGDLPGGHHREGVLIFNEINPASAYVALKIKDVGGIPERLFTWNIK